MRMQAGRAPATGSHWCYAIGIGRRGNKTGAKTGHRQRRRQGHAPARAGGLRIALAALKGGAATAACSHDGWLVITVRAGSRGRDADVTGGKKTGWRAYRARL